MTKDSNPGPIEPNGRGGHGEREPTRSDLDALARRIAQAHDRHMFELENELSDRLFAMLERYRACCGERYHPAILDRRGDLSL
jgi:hypothetical protein